MDDARQAGLHVRISEADDDAGVDRQERDCRELAARLGWTVAAVYAENDTSAYKRHKINRPDGTVRLRVVRPEFRRLLDDLISGAIDAVICYDLDRVARDPRDLEDLIDEVEPRKIPTRAVTGSLDLSTDAGITMARVMVAIANKSSRDTARRVARKHADLAERGEYGGGGIRAYGYERDGVTIRDDEAAVIRWIAANLLEGASLSATARELDARAIPTVRGGKYWSARSVYSIVTKPRVVGLRTHRGEVVGDANWPPILDRDTWDRVRITLAERAGGATNVLKRWCTGVLSCDLCGHRLQGWRNSRGGSGSKYWCSSRHGGCGRISIEAGHCEDAVESLILTYLARGDVLSRLSAATSRDAVARARRDAAADEGQLKELASLWARRDITMAEYMTARRDIEARLSRWRGLIRQAVPGTVRKLLDADDLTAAWGALGPAQRREVARVVFPGGLRVMPALRNGRFDPSRLVPVQ